MRLAFGSAIRERRRALGLVQREVAARLGWSQSQYSRVERGKINISLGTMSAIAAALGCAIEVLLKSC